MKRRIAAAVLAALMAVPAFSVPVMAEGDTYTVFAMLNGEYDLKDNPTMNACLEEAGLTFEYTSVMGSDLAEKRNLSLASGDYADVFMKAGLSSDDLYKYGSQGIFIPLEDLIRENAPNLTKLLDERDAWKYLTASDGHVYSLPEMGRQEGAVTTCWINKKWMDNLGLEEPKSLDDLYNVLKAFKEQDANGNGDATDEIAFTATDVVKPDLLLPYFDIKYDYGTKLAVVDDELVYVPTSDIQKQYIEFITKLYQEGIMDPNAFTQAHEQQGAIGQTGDVLGCFFDAGAFLTVGRDNDDDYIALKPFTEGTYPLNTAVTPGTLAITDKCENPEKIIAFFDQFYSEEGGIKAIMGIEGETWRMRDDGDWEWILDGEYGSDVSTIRASATIQGAANHPSVWPSFWYNNMSPEVDPDEVYLNQERGLLAETGVVPLPVMNYSEEDSMTIAIIKTDIDSYIYQYVAQVATGELSLEDSWDEYVATMNAMGAEQLFSIYQTAYEAGIAE